MVIRELIEFYTREYRDRGLETARVDAETILAKTLRVNRVDLFTRSEMTLSREEFDFCKERLDRRKQGEPVAYIVGERDFFNRIFLVNSDVLIPRPESEIVVEAALRWMRVSSKETPKVADFGAGSGCIGLSLIAEMPRSELFAVDISEAALDVAKENSFRLGLSSRSSFFHCSVEEFSCHLDNTKFDVVVCNPPYVKRGDPSLDPYVERFEPHQALFSEDDGYHCLKLWPQIAFDLLNRGGLFLMEMGAGQGLEMERHLREFCGYTQVELLKDYSGIERVIQGQKN